VRSAQEARQLECNPLAAGEDLDLNGGVDFLESAPRLADLIGIVGVTHEPPGQAHLGLLVGQRFQEAEPPCPGLL
jgi:hypothetical protein